MGQVAVEIQRRAQAAPEIDEEHHRQVAPIKACPECDQPEHLQGDEDDEKEDVELIVFKHGTKGDERDARPLEGNGAAQRAFEWQQSQGLIWLHDRVLSTSSTPSSHAERASFRMRITSARVTDSRARGVA